MDEPIRILHVIGIMNRGGAETMIMNLYRNIDREIIQFDFVENSDKVAVFDDEIRALGGRIYRCPHYNGRNHLQYKKWWEIFFAEHKGEYPIIHGHLGSTAAIYLKVAKKYGIYTIAHSHNSGTDYSLKAIVYKLMAYNTRNVADYFFACSQQAGIDRFGKKVVHSNRYHVLNNAIDTERFQYREITRRGIREEFGYLSEQVVIGHIGRFDRQKNHKFLIAIFSELYHTDKNIRLLLVGDGKLRKSIQRQVEKLGIAEAVSFAGVRSDVNRILQAMDIFVFPSIYEGLPVTLVEAQTAGLPCVISDHVPSESILIGNLVTVQNLRSSAERWASHILSRVWEKQGRIGRAEEVKSQGYDITDTAKWLGEFYLEKND